MASATTTATTPSTKMTILSLPNELLDMICREFLLELYENEGSYAENEVSLVAHMKTFRRKIDTLTLVPGFTASNILAKSKYLPLSTQLLWCEPGGLDYIPRGEGKVVTFVHPVEKSKIRVGYSVKDVSTESGEDEDEDRHGDMYEYGDEDGDELYPAPEETFQIILEQRQDLASRSFPVDSIRSDLCAALDRYYPLGQFLHLKIIVIIRYSVPEEQLKGDMEKLVSGFCWLKIPAAIEMDMPSYPSSGIV